VGNQQHTLGPFATTIRGGRSRSRRWCMALLCLLLAVGHATFDPHKLQTLMQERYGSEGVLIFSAWKNMLAQTYSSTELAQLEQVNQFFNQRLQFTDDYLLWQEKDYWATPLQTMGKRGGDCEDFVIAKYVSLLKLGMPADKLRLIYVRAHLPGTGEVQAHMVLGYYATPDAIPLILDNLQPTITSAEQRSDLTPVFSFNSQGLWIGDTASTSSPTARLSRWRDVLQRMQQEGLAP